MKKINYLFLFIMLFVSINGCKKDEPEQEEQQESEQIELKEVNFTIELPNNISNSAISDYKLSNVYGDYDINITANKSGNKNTLGGATSTVEVLDNGSYQIIYLINPQEEPVMCSIAELENTGTGNYIVSARTTALAMLLSHPLLITTNQTVKNKIEQLIVTMPSFNTYLNDVENLIQQSISQQMTPDFTAPVSYKQTILEVINSNMENFNLTPPNGMLEVDLVERNNGILKYTVTNHHKRVLHIYPKKVWIDDNTGVTIQEEAFEEFGLPKIELLPSKGFNFWSSTWALVSGGDMSIFKVTSDVLEADISSADKLKLEIYGIGKLDTPFDQLSQEEQLKIVLVGMHGAYQDFIMPTIDLFLGVKNFESAGENNQHFDFRYGSKKAPFRQLITNLANAFSSDANELAKLKNNLANKDFIAIAAQFGLFAMDQIFGDAQPEDVKRRYLNNIYDMYKNTFGISSTSEKFRNLIKKGANQISAVKNANFVGQVVSIAELTTNVAGAIYAYYDCDVINTFYINKTSNTVVTLLSPENNYVIPSNTNEITFTWDFDRGNYIGTISYELIIDETLNNGSVITHTYPTGTEKFSTISINDFDVNSTTFNWKIKVLNTQGNLLVESDVWQFTTQNNQLTVTDYDGNVYETIQIGNQIWMKENLKVTHYADGTPIPLVTSNTDWDNLQSIDKAYCWVNNDISNKDTYGALYTFGAATNGIPSSSNYIQGICPNGWHIPTYDEASELINFLDTTYGTNYTGGSLKLTGTDFWQSPNTNATNQTNFSAYPAGIRGSDGSFMELHQSASFHTIHPSISNTHFTARYDTGSMVIGFGSYARSCRCIKD